MIANLVASALSPETARFVVKYIARPALYFACLWLIWSWDADRITAVRMDATAVERARWEASLAESNKAVMASHLAAERAARIASEQSADEMAALRKTLEDLEKANAAAPNADHCGLSSPRSGLLR